MLCSWSGGKDSCYAMMQAMQLGYHCLLMKSKHIMITVLLTGKFSYYDPI